MTVLMTVVMAAGGGGLVMTVLVAAEGIYLVAVAVMAAEMTALWGSVM